MKAARPRNGPATRCRQRGYILIAFSLSALFLVGMCGLAVDLGRMYVAKSEAQSFVDSMALTAALQLNGDRTGLTAAENAVKNGVGSKYWQFGTTPFSPNSVPSGASDTTRVLFSSSVTPGDWEYSDGVPNGTTHVVPTGPQRPVDTNRVRVITSVDVPLYLLPVLVGSTKSHISASATAVRSTASEYAANSDVIPLSPMTHKGTVNLQIDDPNDPYGFQVGQYYTLMWDKQGQNKLTQCPGDGPDVRAFADSGKNGEIGGWLGGVCQGANVCKDALDGNGISTDFSTGKVDFPTKEGKATSVFHASDSRVKSDDDQALSYFGPDGYAANRTGNGKRLVIAPVNDGTVYGGTGQNSAANIIGMAAFLLMDSDFLGGGAICGQYLGTAIPGQPFSGGVAPGSEPGVSNAAFALRLVQ